MTDVVDAPTVLAAALAAHDAGLCVIPGRADGTKRPAGNWQQWQTHRPTRTQIETWFAGGHPALMVVCGAVSGIEMLELEGRAVAAGLADRIDELAHQQHLDDLLDRIVTGYCETTPSGGLHLLYRCDEIDGNLKLARDTNGAVLIETRGEGGVVMVAPSHGPTHNTGSPWRLTDGGFDRITTITPEERQALHALMATLDQAGPTPAATITPTPPRPVTPWKGIRVDNSWMDAVVAHLNTEMPLRQRLEQYGWTYSHSDARGDLMRRPGKTDGVSARINLNGRLMNWSSSAPFAVAAAGHRPTFDALDVVAAYEHRGDRNTAARAVAEQSGILQPRHTTRNTTAPTSRQPAATATNLPDTFWATRDHLTHIRQAAHHRSRSADAVLGCILARIAAFTPPCWYLPAIVGATSTISTYVALVGPSGAGKSSAKQVAIDLMPATITNIADDLPLGSGEGLMEVFYDWVTEDKPDGGKGTVRVKRKVRDGAFLTLDEGQALADLGARKGSTLIATLRSAWTGGTLGTTNASIETKRLVSAGSYALGLVIGLQPTLATALLDDAGGGLPQRFAWFDVTDPTIPDERPPWPGTLDWRPPPIIRNGDGLTVDDNIEHHIRTSDLARQRRTTTTHPLDAHGDLVCLKLAACLAVLDGRTHVDQSDWHLADTIWQTSRTVRATVIEEIAAVTRQAEEARTAAVVRREAVVVGSTAARAIDSMSASIARVVRRHAETTCADGCPRRHLHAATAAKHRELVTLDDAIDQAVRLRWITPEGDRWKPGKATPT